MGTPTGDRIKQLREVRGMTQEQLANAVGTSAGQLSKWERGDVLPRAQFIVPLADALRTTADHLLRNEGDLPRGLAEMVATSEALGQPLTDDEIAWCRSEVRSHGDVSVAEWAARLRTKRRGPSAEQVRRQDDATAPMRAIGEKLGVPKRRR